MTEIEREKYASSYFVRGELGSLFFGSCNLFDFINKIVGRAKKQMCRTSLNTITTSRSPCLFFPYLISHPLYNSVALRSPFIHSYYGSPYKQSIFTAGFSSCLTALLHNTVLINVSTISKYIFHIDRADGQ